MSAVAFLLLLAGSAAAQGKFQSSDFHKLRSVGAVQWSPDGTRIAYTITNNQGPGQPYAQLWLLNVASGQSVRVGDEASRGSQPLWSPDGKSLAYVGSIGGKTGLIICAADGSSPTWKVELVGTNSSALTNTAAKAGGLGRGRRGQVRVIGGNQRGKRSSLARRSRMAQPGAIKAQAMSSSADNRKH